MLDSKHIHYSYWHQLEWRLKYLVKGSAGSGARTLCIFVLHLLIYFYFNKKYKSIQWAMEWTLQNSVIKHNLNDLRKVSRAPTTFRLSGVGIIKGNTASKWYSYVHVMFWTPILILRANFEQANHTPFIHTTRWLSQAQLLSGAAWRLPWVTWMLGRAANGLGAILRFPGNGTAEAFKKKADSWLHCHVCFTGITLWHRFLSSKILTWLL